MKTGKKIAIGIILVLFVLVLLVLVLAGGDDDEDYDLAEYEAGYEENDNCDENGCYDDEYDDDGYAFYDDEYDNDDDFWGSDDEYSEYGYDIPEDTNLLVSDFRLGTCGEMEGRTLLVSVYLNDLECSWENGQESVIYDGLNYTGIATDWITESVAGYGCASEFIYDWTEYPDLYYEGTVGINMLDDSNPDYIDYTVWQLIDENIDSAALLSKYNADNIGYLIFLNTPKGTSMTSCTRNYYDGMAYPYEMCYIYMFFDGEEEAPGGIAHEILHLFGAPDLYREDTYGDNYGVSGELVSELGRIQSNDIMFTNYDAKTGATYYDKISNELTELDAYYIGIIDSCDFANEWGLQPSQHY